MNSAITQEKKTTNAELDFYGEFIEYVCGICRKGFRRQKYLRRHVELTHRKPITKKNRNRRQRNKSSTSSYKTTTTTTTDKDSGGVFFSDHEADNEPQEETLEIIDQVEEVNEEPVVPTTPTPTAESLENVSSPIADYTDDFPTGFPEDEIPHILVNEFANNSESIMAELENFVASLSIAKENSGECPTVSIETEVGESPIRNRNPFYNSPGLTSLQEDSPKMNLQQPTDEINSPLSALAGSSVQFNQDDDVIVLFQAIPKKRKRITFRIKTEKIDSDEEGAPTPTSPPATASSMPLEAPISAEETKEQDSTSIQAGHTSQLVNSSETKASTSRNLRKREAHSLNNSLEKSESKTRGRRRKLEQEGSELDNDNASHTKRKQRCTVPLSLKPDNPESSVRALLERVPNDLQQKTASPTKVKSEPVTPTGRKNSRGRRAAIPKPPYTHCNFCEKLLDEPIPREFLTVDRKDVFPPKCPACEEKHKDLDLYVRIRSSYKKKEFVCAECRLDSPTAEKAMKHLKKHTGATPYTLKENADFYVTNVVGEWKKPVLPKFKTEEKDSDDAKNAEPDNSKQQESELSNEANTDSQTQDTSNCAISEATAAPQVEITAHCPSLDEATTSKTSTDLPSEESQPIPSTSKSHPPELLRSSSVETEADSEIDDSLNGDGRTCLRCGKKFRNPNALRKHMESHVRNLGAAYFNKMKSKRSDSI